MADPFKEAVEDLAKNVGQLVSKLDDDVEERVNSEKRMTTLENKVSLLMWILAVVGLGTIGSIITAIATLLKGH